MRTSLSVIAVAGAACVVYGVALVSIPAAWVVGGAGVCWAAWRLRAGMTPPRRSA